MKKLNFLRSVLNCIVLVCFIGWGTSLFAQEKEENKDPNTKGSTNQSTSGEKEIKEEDGGLYESSWYDEPEVEETESEDTVPLPSRTFSLMLGGLPLENSLLLLAKAGLEIGHFGAYLEVTRDDLLNERDDNSHDHYFRWSYSATGRFYSGKPGRDLFAEVAFSYSYLSLWVTESNGETFVDKGSIPTGGLGVGYRLVKKPKGIFGEIGARANMFLSDEHLYTTWVATDKSKEEHISDRSWFFESGKFNYIIYVALGVTF